MFSCDALRNLRVEMFGKTWNQARFKKWSGKDDFGDYQACDSFWEKFQICRFSVIFIVFFIWPNLWNNNNMSNNKKLEWFLGNFDERRP